MRALKSHDGKITYDWLNDQFNKYWEQRGEAAMEVTRLFLGDAKYATDAELLFPAAAVNVNIASAFFGVLSEPQPLLDIQSHEDIIKLIVDLAGEPAENVLAKFKAPPSFTSAKSVEPVA